MLYSLEMVLIGFFVAGRVRGKVFTSEFMEKNFDREHREATFQSIENSEGYPDMGQGKYADKLSYENWLWFGKAQRTHYNFLENWGP